MDNETKEIIWKILEDAFAKHYEPNDTSLGANVALTTGLIVGTLFKEGKLAITNHKYLH